MAASTSAGSLVITTIRSGFNGHIRACVGSDAKIARGLASLAGVRSIQAFDRLAQCIRDGASVEIICHIEP